MWSDRDGTHAPTSRRPRERRVSCEHAPSDTSGTRTLPSSIVWRAWTPVASVRMPRGALKPRPSGADSD